MPRLSPLRIALFVGLSVVALRLGGCSYLARLDMTAMDLRLLQRGPLAAGDDVVVVAVDDASIAALGRWPWSPSLVARLLDRISDAEPAAVGFDIVWSERSSAAEEDELARAVRTSARVALGYFFDFEANPSGAVLDLTTEHIVKGHTRGFAALPEAKAVTANLPALTQVASEAGYFNFLPDPDGVFRRGALAIRYAEQTAVPLSLALLRVLDPKRALQLNLDEGGAVSVLWGDTEIPVGEDGQLLINFRGGREAFRPVPASDVLAGKIARGAWRDKLVLVGVTATAVADVRNTVFDGQLPGVLIHANILDNILRGDFLRQPRLLVLLEVPTILLLAVALGLAMRRIRGVAAALGAVGLIFFYLIASQWLFVRSGILLSVVFPLGVMVLSYFSISLHQFLIVEQEKKLVRRMLELYLSPSLAAIVSEQPELLRNTGEKRDLTILFSDIRRFTTISEAMGPDVVPLLNAYLAEMTDVIFRYDGTVRYVGDAIMAVWNAPLAQPDHAERGCRAALGMVARLRELDSEWAQRGWPALRIGVGLNSGPMVFGNLGSSNHLSFEIVGDHANLGSRIEGLTKAYGCTMLASEATVQAAHAALTVRELDVVRVMGKDRPVRIFEILGPPEDGPRWAPVIELFQRGLQAYREQRWEEARAEFDRLLVLRPDDGPAALFLSRCSAAQQSPPPPDWDGTTTMDSK